LREAGRDRRRRARLLRAGIAVLPLPRVEVIALEKVDRRARDRPAVGRDRHEVGASAGQRAVGEPAHGEAGDVGQAFAANAVVDPYLVWLAGLRGPDHDHAAALGIERGEGAPADTGLVGAQRQAAAHESTARAAP
jgi:hypothetical protein